MVRKTKLSIFALSYSFVLILAFQNCSKDTFNTADSASQKESGNGGNYDGKISFVLADPQNLCGDGSLIRSRIEKASSLFFLTRKNCADIAAVELPAAAITIDTTGQLLNYSGDTFVQVRDPWLQPFSSTSVWNTAIGAGATWSLNTDPDTTDLHSPGFDINAGQWSAPFYLSRATDTQKLVNSTTLPTQTLFFPAGFHFSGPTNGGDKAFVMMDVTRHWMHQYNLCVANGSDYNCDYGVKDDTCSDGLGEFDLGRGMMRSWEIQSGQIKHVLRFALPLNLNKPNGVVWPALLADYQGVPSSTGKITYGATIGIPSTVDISSLGLSRGGQILATALQEYGAIQRDNTGHNGGITFYAEESAESLPELAEMRADLAKITPVLKIMRNQSPANINGGGARRQPALPAVDPIVCH